MLKIQKDTNRVINLKEKMKKFIINQKKTKQLGRQIKRKERGRIENDCELLGLFTSDGC